MALRNPCLVAAFASLAMKGEGRDSRRQAAAKTPLAIFFPSGVIAFRRRWTFCRMHRRFVKRLSWKPFAGSYGVGNGIVTILWWEAAVSRATPQPKGGCRLAFGATFAWIAACLLMRM